MTLDEAIKELQRAKRARAKELRAKYPNKDIKEINKQAGQVCLIGKTNEGYIEKIDFTARKVWYCDGDYTYAAVNVSIDA